MTIDLREGENVTCTFTNTSQSTPVPTITVSKTLACQPAGGPIAGQIGITVAGGNVVVSAYQDWIEYQLSGQTTWTRAGGTTVQLDPPVPLPATLGPGPATWGYRGTYAGVPVDAELIRNVAVLVTDLAGDPVRERGGGAAERGVWGVQRAGGAVLWGTAGADDHGEQDAGVPAGGWADRGADWDHGRGWQRSSERVPGLDRVPAVWADDVDASRRHDGAAGSAGAAACDAGAWACDVGLPRHLRGQSMPN